jgi:hypothetical protein
MRRAKQNTAAAASSRPPEKFRPSYETAVLILFAQIDSNMLRARLGQRSCRGACVKLLISVEANVLFEHRLVELVPIVQVVQVHCVFRRRSIISHAACAQNAASRFVVMIVTAHRGVMLFDGAAV